MREKIINFIYLYFNPAIHILLIAVGLIPVYFIILKMLPKVTPGRRNRFNGEMLRSEQIKKNSWGKQLIFFLRAAQGKKRDSDDAKDVSDDFLIQTFLIRTSIFFALAYVGVGYWSGLLMPSQFKLVNLFDKWLWIISSMVAIFPYVIMQIRLHRVRVKNSYDLVPATNSLLLRYRDHNGKLYNALYDLCKLDLQGEMKVAFMALLPALQGRNDITTQDSVDLFIYRIKTVWALQVGVAIQKEVEQGDDIEQVLTWIVKDMSDQTQVTDELKVDGRETIQMAYLPAFILPGAMLFNWWLNDSRVWYYYFGHPTGVKIMIFAVFYCFFCAVTAFILAKPRNGV
jgi:hypothetical protein